MCCFSIVSLPYLPARGAGMARELWDINDVGWYDWQLVDCLIAPWF